MDVLKEIWPWVRGWLAVIGAFAVLFSVIETGELIAAMGGLGEYWNSLDP
jgi:hypothetical protein